LSAGGRLWSLDVLKGIVITAVILMHVCYLFPREVYGAPSDALMNVFNAVLRFAPIIFIASVVLLTYTRHSVRELMRWFGKHAV
jgi:surface polysaccharide O-acyltransferase-like enzyme